MSLADPRPLTGRKFLAILVAAFVVVSAVNGAMIWLGLSTWPGLVSDSAYQDGLGFDKVLAQSRAEAALGWRAAIGFDAGAGRLTVRLDDARGEPLSGLRLSAQWLRPASEGQDRQVELAESAPGVYGAAIRPPLPGQWDVRVTVRQDGAVRFHAGQRILIGP
jgi:nitrogen fixation protein FixH